MYQCISILCSYYLNEGYDYAPQGRIESISKISKLKVWGKKAFTLTQGTTMKIKHFFVVLCHPCHIQSHKYADISLSCQLVKPLTT